MARFLATMLALMLPAAWAAPAEPAGTQNRYRNPIVFGRSEHEESTGRVVAASKLWVMEEDGSGLRQITFGGSREDHPSFYSDQRHILYAEHLPKRQGGDQVSRLVKLDIYGGAREVLTEMTGRCNMNHPALSPLGDLVAYQVDCSGPTRHSQMIGLGDGGYEVNTIAHNAVALPDGSIFMHQKDYLTVTTNQWDYTRQVAIARMFGHGKGAKVVFLTGDNHLNRRPAVSPDGKWFAWQTNAAGGEDEIFLARIDGSEPRNLTNAPGHDGHPWFSRDGKWIVFESDRTGAWEIWKLNIETGKAAQLTFGGKKYTSTRARM